MRCIAIDDEKPALEVMKNYIARIPELILVDVFTNPIEAMLAIKKQQIELVFLDIQMPELTGLELKQLIDDDIKVIFCTAYSEFAVEGFNVNAVDYLLKPISFDRFSKAVSKVLSVQNNKTEEVSDDYIFVKTEQKGKIIKINFKEIDYIESLGNYVSFQTESDKVIAYYSLKELEELLPKANFQRIHKSFIINTEKISMLENGFVILKNKANKTLKVPIGNSYKEYFLLKLKKKLI
ncbi:LytTR family DNA-binding domain-containing protein [Soonwooa sp.]|uniref:LytR/AlgR family response regulator transcription factor n=1 Tax=Soonwooa sp. TaxID=1938592 RepID=UPI002629D326|nr:LytTR family DNA-binding domain-containing protein [Soonwooa sp.]